MKIVKFKNYILGFSVLLATQAFAVDHGTGVGNGTGGERQSYIEQVRKSLEDGRVGKSPQNGMMWWCSEAGRILRDAKNDAANLIARNELEAARQKLKDAFQALAQSLDSDPNQTSPITKKLVDRAVVYSRVLEEALDGDNDPTNLLTEVKFLIDYADFVVDTEENLDRQMYIPYVYQHNRCHECGNDFDFDRFQRTYVKFAQHQLEFLLEDFLIVRNENGQNAVYVKGSIKAFLFLSEFTTAYVAQDLSENIYADYLACPIEHLVDISNKLKNYNRFPGSGEFLSARQALFFVNYEVTSVIDNISSKICR